MIGKGKVWLWDVRICEDSSEPFEAISVDLRPNASDIDLPELRITDLFAFRVIMKSFVDFLIKDLEVDCFMSFPSAKISSALTFP